MILRLEHVHYVRPERLRGPHDERARWVGLSTRGERSSRPVDKYSSLEQCVHELRGRREIRLIRRKDVAARIAEFWRV
jgi:hypothetical protein